MSLPYSEGSVEVFYLVVVVVGYEEESPYVTQTGIGLDPFGLSLLMLGLCKSKAV